MELPDKRPSERSSQARLLLPPAVVLVAFILVSTGLHLPVYGVLGALAAYWDARVELPRARPIEVTFRGPPTPGAEPSPEVVNDEVSTPSEAETEAVPEPTRDERRAERRRREESTPPEPVDVPEPEPEPEPEVAPVELAETPPPPPEDDRRAVVQESADPTVEAPPDARFLAEEANDVEEETVAEITSTVTDDPNPTISAPEAAETDDAGDGTEETVADARDVDGSPDRHVTPEEARETPPDVRADPSRSPRPTTGAGADEAGSERTAEAGSPSRGDDGGATAHEGGLTPTHEVLVSDGYGSYVVRVPDIAPGTGGGDVGGARTDGTGAGTAGTGTRLGRAGREGGGRERSGERAGRSLGRLSWSDFEAVYGEEELEREREARLEERRSHHRGASREREWTAFRAAMENYIAEVRPGNQTALDAAASPFAVFLNQMHARIHRHFAEDYIGSLGMDATEGQNDASLRTTLEVAVNPDGTLYRIGIVRTSGNTMFDFGAFNSMYRAQPFPEPPDVIMSGDGRAWLHWTFDRNERLCGTWNAEPFILENGTSLPTEPRHDDGPETPDGMPPSPGEPAHREEPVPT